MSEMNIRIRKLQDNGSTFRATPETLYMGGVGSARVDTLRFEVPEEWNGCAISLHVKRLSGALPDQQLLDEKNRAVVDQRWTKEKQGLWMLMAVGADGYTAMTKPGRYTCYETIDRDSTTEAITPSVYEQFVALVKKETAEANRAAKNAAASAEIAKNFESTITATGEQVQREITATADQTKKDLTATADQTKQAIEEKAKAALASIPEDYTAMSESVGQLKEDINDLYSEGNLYRRLTFEQGGLYGDGSKAPVTDTAIRTTDFIQINDPIFIEITDEKVKICRYFATDRSFNRADKWDITESFEYTGSAEYVYKIALLKADGSDIHPDTLTTKFKMVGGAIDDLRESVAVAYEETSKITQEILGFAETGKITTVFTWVPGAISPSGAYADATHRRTKKPVYFPDGSYIVSPNGAEHYAVVAYADENYANGRTLRWYNDAGDSFTVGGGRNYVSIAIGIEGELDQLVVWQDSVIGSMQEDINSVKAEVDELRGALPSYYTDNYYFSYRLENLQARLESVSNGDAFIFTTDMHMADNAGTGYLLTREILRNTSINKVICGGDIPTAYNEGTTFTPPVYSAERSLQMQARRYAKLVGTYIKPYARYYAVRGNHDFHIQQNPSSTMIVEPESWSYNYFVRACEEVADADSGKLYYSFDNTSQKIRYIMINTNDMPNDGYGVSQEQYDWLIQRLRVEEGWQIVVVGHVPIYSEMASYQAVLAPVWGILVSYQNRRTYSISGDVTINVNFAGERGKIIAYLCGHNHKSQNFKVDGLLTASFICDAKYTTDQTSRGYKTIQEASIAAVVIDKDRSIIKEFNFGAGYNREMQY